MTFESFDLNVLTITFILTVATNLFGLWGAWKQTQTIWNNNSGRSVSVIMAFYTVTFLTAVAVYGVRKYGWALPENAFIVNMVRVPCFIAIVIGLWWYKGFKHYEYLVCTFFAWTVVWMGITEQMEELLFVLSVGTWISFAPQTYEIWKDGRGAADIRFLWTTVVAVMVWTVFAFALGDVVLMITNPIFLAIVGGTLVLWYAKGEKTAVSSKDAAENEVR
jgi:hypothetical protein